LRADAFLRASPQSPRRFAPAGLSVDAISAGVATLHFNQLLSQFRESIWCRLSNVEIHMY
jgi:hypothetical protein